MASCSVPLLFPIYVIDGYSYCDGGICNNFPTNLFEDTYTIGFSLFDENSNIIPKGKTVSIVDIFGCVLSMTNNSNNKDKKENICNILDYNYDNQTYNLNQSKDDIFSLYMNGYTNTKKFIFDNFIALKN
jgi:predicted patatin/cPLA2 family phospholipase